MTAPATDPRADADRPKRAIKAVHACRRQVAGLEDEDSWRDFLDATVGKRSLREMTGRELGRVIDALHARGAPKQAPKARLKADGQALAAATRDPRTAAKIRALWFSLWNLGVVRERHERALDAFVKRQTGVDRLAWLAGDQAYQVIEALKDWAARPVEDGGAAVDWSDCPPRVAVLRAQWGRMQQLGIAVHQIDATIDEEAADATIRAWGERIRAALGEDG